MSREWKPGDVAMARIQLWSGLVLCIGPDEWVTDDGDGRWETHQLADLRPLVVIDPEDREQVGRLLGRLAEMNFSTWACGASDCLQAALRESADPKPPKPEEPTGLGAVVEDADGQQWVRIFVDNERTRDIKVRWADGEARSSWDGIDAVRILSEGVQA